MAIILNTLIYYKFYIKIIYLGQPRVIMQTGTCFSFECPKDYYYICKNTTADFLIWDKRHGSAFHVTGTAKILNSVLYPRYSTAKSDLL